MKEYALAPNEFDFHVSLVRKRTEEFSDPYRARLQTIMYCIWNMASSGCSTYVCYLTKDEFASRLVGEIGKFLTDRGFLVRVESIGDYYDEQSCLYPYKMTVTW